jgi:predicted acylesterase/phospholipase RssA
MAKNNNNVQRALVLQGGGSLGAYEAGVFNVLYYWITKQSDAGRENDNVFDVIAGTSIGAINAAFLVGDVVKKRKEENKSVSDSWEGSAERLEEFWKSQLASNVNLSRWWPFSWDERSWTCVWDMLHDANSDIARGEAARRYYSAKEFIINGAPNVFLPRLPPKIDYKFFDNFLVPNIWYRYDNSRLKETINRCIRFPIATSLDEKEPRLLAISVDIEEGETVTFDSYVKEKEIETRKSDYGDYEPVDNDGKKKGTYERTIRYDKGLMTEHIIASASVPEHYDYTLVPKEYDYTKTEQQKSLDIQNNDLENYSRFWDGGMLSNTPLRELIQSHQDYWTLVEKIADSNNSTRSIPNLEVYIIDVWPSVDDDYPVPLDLDGIRDRKNDLTYQDKTPYDEKVANIVSDYYNLTKSLIELVKKKGATKTEIDAILDTPSKSSHRSGLQRKYRDLVDKRFDITKVIRIERSFDKDDIANKWCDFSLGTITNLFNKGIEDALETLAKEVKKSKNIQVAYSEMDLFIRNVKKQKANYTLVQYAENLKATLPNLKVL